MKISRKKHKTLQILACSGELTIYTVATTKNDILNNLDDAIETVALDLRDVSKLDTAGLQLLLFAKHSMADSNKRLYVKTSNDHVDNVFKIFGVADQFILEK
ncbi:MAG TPA: STAS domain-containing protein [Cellvibrionaceae bacterium]